MASPLIMNVMALSLNAANKAGWIIRDVMQKGCLEIIEKESKDDLQTKADRSAQESIIGSLHGRFPDIKIIGEEGISNLDIPPEFCVKEPDEEFLKNTCPEVLRDIKDEDLVVWVDPLDGTSEYTQGFLEHVTVLIGIAVKNSAVGGVIHQPYYKKPNGELGRTLWGLKGLGTGGIDIITPPANEFIVTTTRSHLNPTVQAAIDALSPSKILKVGGAGYKVLQLLGGQAHAYVFASSGCKKWDTCAPEAILESAGGVLTDLTGQHYSYHADVEHRNKKGVLAAIDPIRHSEIVQKIPKNVIEALSGT